MIIEGIARVSDGDGLSIDGHEVRLAGLDAPEHDQLAICARTGRTIDVGNYARNWLRKRVEGQYVRAKVEKVDHYGRYIAVVYDEDGRDVGASLVRSGLALCYYGNRYRLVEDAAKQDRNGLWGMHGWTPPWEHRSSRYVPNEAPVSTSSTGRLWFWLAFIAAAALIGWLIWGG